MNKKQGDNIRNFCIIAHIDHGKSTLADRFLELTSTVEKRKMKEQYLDMMDLEKERGITIKLQPVVMSYKLPAAIYKLNLIDTPGHIDFSYEVSRSLKAVEGAILLVDATQGVQAQTVSNLEASRELGLVIVPVVNKIDSPNARVEETKREIIEILECEEEDILEISAKTGEGVEALMKEIIRRVPPPRSSSAGSPRSLVFDFEYSVHKGVILYVRVMDGSLKKGDNVFLYQAGKGFVVGEVGVFRPASDSVSSLSVGEIGYVVTKLKEANIARVGDTLISKNSSLAPLEGYKKPAPVVWAGVYTESQDDFVSLKQALQRLNLSDSSLTFEEEESGILGRGFRCGFLGMLHLEIVAERLKREFGLVLVVATPSVVYKVEDLTGKVREIYSPALFPEHFEIKKIFEPWVRIKIITPADKLNDVLRVLRQHDALIGETQDFGASGLSRRFILNLEMPLREMMDGFFEQLKSATSGYASLSYEIVEGREADLVKLDVLLNEENVSAFSRIVKKSDMQREAQKTADKLKKFLPPALFVIKIQVKALGRILSARSITALKKDVTGYLYGGDITRKQKLWKKQKRGKEKLKKFGRVNVPHDVFLKMIRDKD